MYRRCQANFNALNFVRLSLGDDTNEFVDVIQQARLNSSFDDSCDVIAVYNVRYAMIKVSGFIWINELLKRKISVKRSGDSKS